MANYVAKVRTNYFKVKDQDAWQAFCDRYEFTNIIDTQDGERLNGFMDTTMGHGLPTSYYDEKKDEDVEIDFTKELSKHIEDGWVAIIVEIGAEKYRYLLGFAVAVNSKNECRQVTLDEIIERAKELGKKITEPQD